MSRRSSSKRSRHQFGLDLPMWQQFTNYCGDALTGDFGTSYQFHAPVIDKITEALPATLLLTGTAYVLYTALGIWLGTRTAWRNGSRSDRFNTAFALTLYSIPSFWLGLLLIIVFSVGIGPIPGLFPTGGLESGGESGLRVRHRRRAPSGPAGGHAGGGRLRADAPGDALLAARRDGQRLSDDGAREGSA